jgi:hypothetical protein
MFPFGFVLFLQRSCQAIFEMHCVHFVQFFEKTAQREFPLFLFGVHTFIGGIAICLIGSICLTSKLFN